MATPTTLTRQRLDLAVDELGAQVTRLAALEVSDLDPGQQARALQGLGRVESSLAAVRLRLLSAADRAHTARKAGAADTGAWAAGLMVADSAATHRDVGLARSLDELPATRTALGDGEVSTRHASVIARALDQLPDHVRPDQRHTVEDDLVSKAKQLNPQLLRRAARRALEASEPDPAVVDAHEDALVRDEETAARAKTRLSFHENGDGTVTGRFIVPVLQGHLLRKVIETMTAPRRGRLGASQAQTGPAQGPRTDWDHARGLAFCELIEHLPTDHLHPKTAASVVVTMRDDVLRGQLAAAGLDTGESISAGEARRLACSAGLIPAVLGGRSVPLDLGRTRRLFSHSQGIALGLRHKTCLADGCQRPFSWCELHHRNPWALGGKTDLDHADPLCNFHHHKIHDPGYLHTRLPDGSIRFTRRT